MSNDNLIKMVFFDAAGTLFDVRGSVGEIYARYALQYGKQVDPQAIQQAFAEKFRQQTPMAFARGLEARERLQREKQWWRNLVWEVFADWGEFPQFEDYFEQIFSFFRTAAAWQLETETKPTLDAIKQRGLRVGLISNFDARLYDVLRALELTSYFDSIHISTQVGAAKPDATIFATALRENRLAAPQALHVGDSFQEDIEGAQAAGVRAIWVNRQPGTTTIPAVMQVRSLIEILDLF